MSIRHKTRLIQASVYCAIAFLSSTRSAMADGIIAQELNRNLTPAPNYWAVPQGNVGWYWTPQEDLFLIGIQTRLRTGFSNLNNDFIFTTTLYSDRPAVGGTSLGSFTWNGATDIDEPGSWQGGEFETPIALHCGTRYFVGMSGWEQGLNYFAAQEIEGGSGVNWIDPPDQAGGQNLGAGSGYLGTNYEVQGNPNNPVPANVDSPIIRFVVAPRGYVARDLNENLIPGPYFWCPYQIGWYWTPPTNLKLIGVQTQLRTGFSNINNNFWFTTTIWTDRPAVGGTALGSHPWHGARPIDGPWLGGEFDAPIPLQGGVPYFVGMTGWEQGIAFYGGGCGPGGSGVNWIDPVTQPGSENLGAGSGYLGSNFETQMNTSPDPAVIDAPIIRFIAILDADNDDVADEIDQCPNSPAGLSNDEFGRPKLDANLDCAVNSGDLPVIIQELLGLLAAPIDCAGNPLRDANGDGVLNGADVQEITREIVGS